MATTTVTSHQPTPIQLTEQKIHRHRSFHYDQRHSNNNSATNSRHQQVQQIGNYVIYKKTLGSGSMGTVKLAECLSDKDHQLYAVKIMPKVNLNSAVPPTTGDNKQQKDPKDTPREREQRTIREMAIMHLLRHPNICQLKEWVVQGDHYYMFLEYVQGGQLLDYIISHGKLKEKLARKFARQIVSALDYCHRNSIVHRDLKIENILINNNEEIKIIDFGLSNIYSPVRLLNTFCGSLYFAAPELLQAKYYTGPEVDVWSFAVVLYVLVCGRVPFDDTSLPALHKKIKAGHVEYPDHLSKDCVDLLSKLLVVDPLKRETLSFAIHHPWMNKGYDEPICNFLPHRQPLTSIDPRVVQGMQGFGLGSPEEIEKKLHHIISSPEYQYAAAQVDQNYQPPPSEPNPDTTSMTRWRRNLSIRRNQANLKKKDDPQHLPAMYDPLVSIYTLVKERKEFDEKMTLLESEGYPIQLGRSASTSLSKSSTRKQETNLHRRKTERVPPSHHRPQADWADPTTRNVGQGTILQRSKSAAKRLIKTPAYNNSSKTMQYSDEHLHVIDDHRLLHQTSSSTHVAASSLKHSSSLKKKTMNLLRSNSLSDKRYRQQKTSVVQQQQEEIPKMSTQPKSLFEFNRRHLFKVSSSEMLKYVQQVLLKIGMRYMPQGPFTLKCELSDWSRYQQFEVHEDEGLDKHYETDEPVQFTLMIYQARWAGGRLGVKVLEAEDEDRLYRHIHHTILNELGTLLHK